MNEELRYTHIARALLIDRNGVQAALGYPDPDVPVVMHADIPRVAYGRGPDAMQRIVTIRRFERRRFEIRPTGGANVYYWNLYIEAGYTGPIDLSAWDVEASKGIRRFTSP